MDDLIANSLVDMLLRQALLAEHEALTAEGVRRGWLNEHRSALNPIPGWWSERRREIRSQLGWGG